MDASLVPLEGIGPVVLADLMMVAPLRRRANLVVLQPAGGRYELVVKRGSLTLAAFDVPGDVGNAAVARLALMAGVEPTTDASPNARRDSTASFRARAGNEYGEFLLTIAAGPDGLDAELRPLSVNGRPLEPPTQGQLRRCLRCAAFQPPQRQRCEVDGGDLIDVADDPRPGGTIGVYRVRQPLGGGGMGTVLAGEHAIIGRPVAIKLPHPNIAKDPVLARRFLSEARAASRLHHPNVVDVTDYGMMSDGRPYMVMERLEGESLAARLEKSGALTPLEALLITREIALALQAAHDRGVIHRDLKPDNVILLEASREGAPRLKLVDFGAAQILEEAEQSELVCGTPWYMAPEHSRGEETDGRTDLYALGVIAYEMLSGKVPFDGQSHTEVRLAHMTDPVRPPTSPLDAALPEPVVRVVMRALRKEPAERYQSAGEMLVDLEKALSTLERRDWRRWLPI